jgi:hypothetical protein
MHTLWERVFLWFLTCFLMTLINFNDLIFYIYTKHYFRKKYNHSATENTHRWMAVNPETRPDSYPTI